MFLTEAISHSGKAIIWLKDPDGNIYAQVDRDEISFSLICYAADPTCTGPSKTADIYTAVRMTLDGVEDVIRHISGEFAVRYDATGWRASEGFDDDTGISLDS